MALALLIAGGFAVAAGLLAIVYGIPVNEFSFGNTMILAGVIGVCSGMLLIGLSAVVMELKNIARRLGSAVASEARVRPVLPPGRAASVGAWAPEAAPEAAKFEPTLPLSPAAPPPWQDETAARERPRADVPEMSAASGEAPRRRNLMFASSLRRERERAQANAAEAFPPEPRPAAGAQEPPEVPPPSFDDGWPKQERAGPPETPLPRRPPRTPTTFAEPAAPEAPAAPAPEPRPAPSAERPAVTVLKSGVVDGMAYSLYSDGSIEAQMPEGMMRFASIDELRAHLEQRS